MQLSKLVPAWPEGAFALRLIAAAALAMWAGTLLPGGHSFSAVISALLVVRPYQQGALKAGALRLVATLGGIVLAFFAQQLDHIGLNPYVRLMLALAPLSLVAAYDSSYRTALIAAVLILSAPVSQGAVDIAIARAVVVTLGAAIGTLVSIIVLPSPHKQVVAAKALKILSLMLASLQAANAPASPASEKAEGNLRKALLELSQMARDNGKNHKDDDHSGQIVRLVRHAQACILLLRSQWRKSGPDAAYCQAALDTANALRKNQPVELQMLYQAVPESQPDAFLARSLADDIARLAKLCVAV